MVAGYNRAQAARLRVIVRRNHGPLDRVTENASDPEYLETLPKVPAQSRTPPIHETCGNPLQYFWEMEALHETTTVAEVVDTSSPFRRASPRSRKNQARIQQIQVSRVRPEEGLGRRRDRQGHAELCRSIEQFGVLTPITVRPAPDDSGEFLLIKGQGRTLACRMLGIARIPAVVVSADYAETEKVQQFLVENVARLKMRPVERALLVAHSRRKGEETIEVARRFGISAATVRRLESQLEGANSGEIAALRAGDVNLSVHAVIARHVQAEDRLPVIRAVGSANIRAGELEALFIALGWQSLVNLGPDQRSQRLRLFEWCCTTLSGLPRGKPADRFRLLATSLPMSLVDSTALAGTR
jgi:ParB/RepB/Spo0J family partition protein